MIRHMELIMRTTLTIDADVLSAFKRVAADTNRTLSGVIEDALREQLARRRALGAASGARRRASCSRSASSMTPLSVRLVSAATRLNALSTSASMVSVVRMISSMCRIIKQAHHSINTPGGLTLGLPRALALLK